MGFDADKFVSGISDDKKCGVCNGVLDNPVRATCGHLFCSGCILPWVVRHGSCPHGCQPLTPRDLENVLPLREVILNLQVRCEYRPRGCQAVVRLTDLIAHIQDCSYRPVKCGHPHCGATVSHRQLAEHEGVACEYRPVSICQEGCGLVLVHKTRHNHHCATALRELVNEQEQHVVSLERELERKDRSFQKRERILLAQVTSLQRKVKQQAKKFHNQLTDLRHHFYSNELSADYVELQFPQSALENSLQGEGRVTTDNWLSVTLTLFRDAAGSLGFNIMGGLTVEKNNNQSSTGTDGIFISRIGEGGPGDLKGLKIYDKVMKVNGQDLSQSSHDEAVEAFRTATEPIVVEVLRRVGKSSKSGSHSISKSRPPSNSSSSSSSSPCTPAMVSIATQTEEDFYCYNRPPTPPPGFYPVHISGLYQPSSRRPVAFSPSAEMGLTDIEMSHNLDFDDPFFDDRQYEMVYEEVVLHRTSSEEKLGLTLCYGSLEDEVTDIFISEIDPCSVAGRDGRVREGDQILQINGVDVHSRDEAISLFAGQDPDITLLVARPQLQIDDGFMEEPNLVLEDLHMDLLEKHHHDNMHFMASMLARTQLEEEGGTTDTATTENFSNKHDKDSGVGRTDESTRNDESSEQEMFDADSLPVPGSKLRSNLGLMRGVSASPYHYSNESVTSTDPDFMGQHVHDIPTEDCEKFRHLLEYRCNMAKQQQDANLLTRKDSEGSLERELAQLNKEMEEIQVECQEIVETHLLKEQQRLFSQQLPFGAHEGAGASNGHHGSGLKASDTQRSPRVVPRMGTRLDCIKHMQALEQFDLWSQQRRMALAAAAAAAANNSHATPSLSSGTGTSSGRSERDRDQSTTSAYNTGGESCRSTPLTLELNVASDESEKGFKNSMLCLAPSAVPPHSSSDTEKQTQTPTGKTRSSSSEDSEQRARVASQAVAENLRAAGLSGQAESLQDLYMRSADIMYTNHANLQHTIAVQQKLFQQQLEQQQKRVRFGKGAAAASLQAGNLPYGGATTTTTTTVTVDDGKQPSPSNTAPSDSGQMEWVVKRRPDGTRYITRRPVRSKILKERAKKITEERSGMTTDDDAMSELKTGRYWSKEERKRHLEKAKDYKRRKETIMKQRMETLKEGEEKKEMNIVELSHRKMNKHKNKKVLDNFVTVQEMLAHGSRIPEGKTYNPLLSVTTV